MTHPEHQESRPVEADPPVTFSRRTAFRFAGGAAGVAAVSAAGAAPSQAETRPHEVECAADLMKEN